MASNNFLKQVAVKYGMLYMYGQCQTELQILLAIRQKLSCLIHGAVVKMSYNSPVDEHVAAYKAVG